VQRSATATKLEVLSGTSEAGDDAVNRQLLVEKSNLIQQASIENLTIFNDRKKQTIAPALDALNDSSAVVLGPSTASKSRVASFTALQEWDGYVVSIGPDSFLARLTDITSNGRADSEEVEISLDELSDSSAAKLSEGSLFRWSIGYERTMGGQKTRVSRIILRLLPRWQASDLERAKAEASEIVEKINWR
jgi:hypothetical protein